MKKHIFLFLGAILAFLGCSDDDSIKNGPTPQPNPGSELDVQHFMWQSMNLWYFWQAEVNDLADDRFSTDAQYTDYLEANPDPEAFYTNKLVHGEDRFSFFNEDYTELVRNLGGVSKSHGVEFKLWLDSNNTNNVYGVVLYVLPGSDGATKDIQRGDGFTRVNGVQLTTANYINLLFGDNDTYTLGMAEIESEIDGDFINFYPVDTDREVSLTKTANLVEDPIFVAKTLDVGGTKVAYLMYNRFLGSFDEQLNQAFGDFKADGATELILDMRYKPGGSVNSSRLLASMVYGTNTSDLYIRQRWNAKIQAQLSASDLEDYFADKTKTSNGTAINSL